MKKRSFSIAGHRTSVALEPEFWTAIEKLAAARGQSLAALIAEADRERLAAKNPPGLASALRVTALKALSSTVGDDA